MNYKNEELLINENNLSKFCSEFAFDDEYIFDKFCVISSHILQEYKFENEDIKDWELNDEETYDKKELLKNKALAMSKMMPEETEKVNESRKKYGMYLNSLIDEYQEIQNTNKIRHKENLTQFIKQIMMRFLKKKMLKKRKHQ